MSSLFLCKSPSKSMDKGGFGKIPWYFCYGEVRDQMEFKEKLKTLRKEKGLSQGDLSSIAGLNKLVISKYERGAATPGLENLGKIAKALGVSADYLIFKDTPKNGRHDFRDPILFEKFVQADDLPDSDRDILKNIIDAMLTRKDLDQLNKKRMSSPKRSEEEANPT